MNDKLNESDFDDEDLDAMLRDVDIPDGLKNSLKQISQTSNAKVSLPVDSGSDSRSRHRLIAWAVAASVAAVAAILVGRSLTDQADNNFVENSKPVLIDESIEQELARDELEPTSLSEQLLMELEIETLRSELAALRAKRPPEPISVHETKAIVAAVSSESHYLLGGSRSTSLALSENVILEFPGTAGAELAQTYISNFKEPENETDL
jgi:hypothetical protein